MRNHEIGKTLDMGLKQGGLITLGSTSAKIISLKTKKKYS